MGGGTVAVGPATAEEVDAALAVWQHSHLIRRNGRPLPKDHVRLAHGRMAAPGAMLFLAREEGRSHGRTDGRSREDDRSRDEGRSREGGSSRDEGSSREEGRTGTAIVGTVLGVQGLTEDGAGPPKEGLIHLSLLSVAPDRWGQRVGRRLMEHVLAEARSRSYTEAQLWTHADNLRANRLYRALGFRRTGRVKIDDWGELLVHYWRSLQEG